MHRPSASVAGNFCNGGLDWAMKQYIAQIEDSRLCTLIRGHVEFECQQCNNQYELCTATTRPGADFGRHILNRAIDTKSLQLEEIAMWLSNKDFAWACAQWPCSFARLVCAKKITSKRIYSPVQACQIISGGNANGTLAIMRASPQHALRASAVKAWNIWIKRGSLLAPTVGIISRALHRSLPLPRELIDVVVSFLLD